MCCFSRAVQHVAGTQIFARAEGPTQWLAYRMSFAAEEDLAMILPLPVAPGSGEDAVEFIDLSGYPKLFEDLERGFPEPPASRAAPGMLAARAAPRPKLVVHDVGDFEASYVPSRGDFDRLDARFRLDPSVWARLPQYADHGFAVFKLRATPPKRRWFRAPKPAPKTVHPMAFSFPRRDPNALFFPTVHIHDGQVHDRAVFDHRLYAQLDPLVAATAGWREATGPIETFVAPDRARGLVRPGAAYFRRELQFEQPNVDIVLVPPACRGPQVLEGSGAYFSFRLSATAAYYTRPAGREAVARQTTARRHLDLLHDHLAAALAELVDARGDAWGLGDAGDDPQQWYLGNDRLWPSRGPMSFDPPPATGPGRVRFVVQTPRIEPVRIELSFREAPPWPVAREITTALEALLAATPLP